MEFKFIKLAFLLLAALLYAPTLSAAEDVDWMFGKEPIFEVGPESPEIGMRWAIGARKNDIQITFRLEVSTDMKNGGWLGDVRAPEKFYVKVYLVNAVGEKRFFQLDNGRAVGPDAEFGVWKEGPATADQQILTFNFKWEQMQMIKKAKAIVLDYSSHDNRDESLDITIPLDNFNTRLDELETSVRKADGGTRFIMTQEEVDTTPLMKLPASIRKHWLDDLNRVSGELSITMPELLDLSMKEIQTLQKDRAKAIKDTKFDATRKAHQAIYDQEPAWFDINICPKPDVSYCNNIGKNAYLDDSMSLVEEQKFVTAMTIKYGKIYGVVWRSKGSIIKIYPGDVKWARDPIIYRAPKAEYYYIIKNGDHIQVNPGAGIFAKG